MSMTIEKAIEVLENGAFWGVDLPCDNRAVLEFHDALDVVIAALRTEREPVKLDRSRWEGCIGCRTPNCCTCLFDGDAEHFPCSGCRQFSGHEPINYCPSCGRPLTEEAWAELEWRIGGNEQ